MFISQASKSDVLTSVAAISSPKVAPDNLKKMNVTLDF